MQAGKRLSRGGRISLKVVGTAGALVALGILSQTATAQNQAVPASWQQHKFEFTYIGISPTYSCEGLRSALTFLLEQSGARLNHPVQTFPCSGGFGGPSSLITAALNFATLQPMQEATSAGAAGSWRHVDFSPTRSNPQLHGADCELVQEFKDRILKNFTVRNVRSTLNCIPHQTIGNQFDLSFDVLAAPDATSRQVGGTD